MSANQDTDQPLSPPLDSLEPGEPPDAAALAQRASRMQNKLLADMSELRQVAASLQRTINEGFDKLNVTFAMLARSVVTNQVKVDDGHLETRRMFSDQLERLVSCIKGELLDRVVERFLLSTVASIIDDVDAVLANARDDDRGLPVFEALAKVRAKLLAGLRPYGVDLVPLTEGETVFDETYHECTKVDTTGDATVGVVIDRDAQGFMLNDRVIRRAKVVVKGAHQ